jgi:hypothetical protein
MSCASTLAISMNTKKLTIQPFWLPLSVSLKVGMQHGAFQIQHPGCIYETLVIGLMNGRKPQHLLTIDEIQTGRTVSGLTI